MLFSGSVILLTPMIEIVFSEAPGKDEGAARASRHSLHKAKAVPTSHQSAEGEAIMFVFLRRRSLEKVEVRFLPISF